MTKGFPNVRVAVVGDVMIDRYLVGTCDRISPEAPVPVVKLTKNFASLGGAANVAANLAAMGTTVELVGITGKDSGGIELRKACGEIGIGISALAESEQRSTIVKTRVLASDRQIVRIDEESTEPISDSDADQIVEALLELIRTGQAQAVILSDYAKGVCTEYLCQRVIQAAAANRIPVYVDPKGVDYERYRGAAGIKPSRLEMIELAKSMRWPTDDLVKCAGLLREHLLLDFVALTLGPEGIAIVTDSGVEAIPTVAREVFDVSGAGDTVIAAMVAGKTAGLELDEAFSLATIAAGVVVAHVGSHPISRQELLSAIHEYVKGEAGMKHFDWEELRVVVDLWKAQGLVVGFTNGCFDLIHAGHVTLLNESASMVDRLIVAVNSDESVRRLKGDLRPLMNEAQRITVLSSMESVDAVVVFGEDTPLELIETVIPEVLIKGGDYKKESVIGREVVEANGGRVELIALVPNMSTSYLAAAIEKL